jgi:hypothetical protein
LLRSVPPSVMRVKGERWQRFGEVFDGNVGLPPVDRRSVSAATSHLPQIFPIICFFASDMRRPPRCSAKCASREVMLGLYADTFEVRIAAKFLPSDVKATVLINVGSSRRLVDQVSRYSPNRGDVIAPIKHVCYAVKQSELFKCS